MSYRFLSYRSVSIKSFSDFTIKS